MPKRMPLLLVLLVATALVGLTLTAQAQRPNDLVTSLLSGNSEGQIAVHPETGLVRFYSAGPSAITGLQAAPKGPAARPEEVGPEFLRQYGTLFGVGDAQRDLSAPEIETADGERTFLRYRQMRDGVPVLGGELVLQVAGGRVISANGELAPLEGLNTDPSLDAATAQATALAAVGKDHPGASLECTPPTLAVYWAPLLGPGDDLARLVWQMEVTSPGMPELREMVLVDAHRGVIALRFNQVDTALNRYIYNGSSGSIPGTLVRTEGGPSTGDTDADNAYTLMGDTYGFYWTHHGRDSVDDIGLALRATVHYSSATSCPNAFWNGHQTVFCDGLVADDVMAHEWTHAVTQYSSGLFYYYQSGAINEALSDIWGEFVDLTNGRGNDGPSVRWLLGEDLASLPVLRSMKNPPAYNDPDRMLSSLWNCDTGFSDQGGVHTNSGVLNKAAYLITDGGSFNGETVVGLGIPKAAAIFYELQTDLLTSGSDYLDLSNLLPQACYNLVGSGGITSDDCRQVEEAVEATEMAQPPTLCGLTEAPLCPEGYTCTDLFFDDLENPASGNWVKQKLAGSYQGWYYPQNPNPYSGFDATYATSGTTNIWGDDPEVLDEWDVGWPGDFAIAMANGVALPAGKQVYLRFNHSYLFEYGYSLDANYDGGVMEYSANGGAWQDAGPLFDHNGYNGSINSGYNNPLASRVGFVRTSYGYTSSRLNLTPLAGQSVRFRFRIGHDSYAGGYGWFLDDIRVYYVGEGDAIPTVTATLVPPTPTPTPAFTPTPAPVNSISINGGARYTNSTTVTLTLTGAPGVVEIRLSNDGGYVEDDKWEPFAATKVWELIPYQDKVVNSTVYVWFRDGGHNVQGAYQDDIILDVNPPQATVGLEVAAAGSVNLTLDAEDDLSGVAWMKVAEDPTFTGLGWQPYQETLVLTPVGNRIYARFKDNAGNESPTYMMEVTKTVYLPMLEH